jgi:uncharacterized protein
MSEAAWTLIASLLMVLGLLGVVVPILPDVALIWAAGLGYGLLVGWGEYGAWLFGAMTLLGLLGLISDLIVSGAGARLAGASPASLLAGIGLGLLALILGGPLAGAAGFILGMFSVELARLKDPGLAMRATVGLALGYGASFGAKMLIGLGMVALWVIWVLSG